MLTVQSDLLLLKNYCEAVKLVIPMLIGLELTKKGFKLEYDIKNDYRMQY